MKLLIKNGRIVDPANNRDEPADILIEAGKITKVAKAIKAASDEVIDARGKLVIPGIIDMHVHLREPGREDKETVASGTLAALKGGVTTLLAMPNTVPAIDSPESIRLLEGIIKKSAYTQVLIAAAITKGRQGAELTDIAALKKYGASAISDDGSSVGNEKLMLEALRQAAKSGIAVICHSEDKSLSCAGVVNAGFTATRLGLRGVSNESEYKRISRDIELAQKGKSAVHIAHVSCKESVEIIAKAKQKGIKVTAEAAPHHFALSEESALTYDTNMKMNPPLRGKEDVEAIKKGLKDGTIDVIASDHAPHTENEKEIEFERAEFGVIGLETLLAVSITELIEKGILDWPGLVRKLSVNPARILQAEGGSLSEGQAANIAVVDPSRAWLVKKSGFLSKSKNSAFIGKSLKGFVEYTVCRGKLYKYSI